MVFPNPGQWGVDAPRTLTAFTKAGLSNRLRVLLSGIALSEASGRTFRMLWPRSPACGAVFRELFTNDWPVVDLDELAPELDEAYPPTSWGWGPVTEDLLAATTPHLVKRTPHWLIAPDRYPAHRPLADRCVELFQALEPIPAIRERLAAFRARHFRPLMIGVHARRGDFVRARPDRSWNTRQILAAVDRFLIEMPEAGILLCTDDGAPTPSGKPTRREGVRGTIRARYGDRLVETSPSSLDRGTPESIQDALLDLLLLRATDAFVGTRASTFSQFVVYGRAVPSAHVGAMRPTHRWVRRTTEVLGIRWLARQVLRRIYGRHVPARVARGLVRDMATRLARLGRDRGRSS